MLFDTIVPLRRTSIRDDCPFKSVYAVHEKIYNKLNHKAVYDIEMNIYEPKKVCEMVINSIPRFIKRTVDAFFDVLNSEFANYPTYEEIKKIKKGLANENFTTLPDISKSFDKAYKEIRDIYLNKSKERRTYYTNVLNDILKNSHLNTNNLSEAERHDIQVELYKSRARVNGLTEMKEYYRNDDSEEKLKDIIETFKTNLEKINLKYNTNVSNKKIDELLEKISVYKENPYFNEVFAEDINALRKKKDNDFNHSYALLIIKLKELIRRYLLELLNERTNRVAFSCNHMDNINKWISEKYN